MCIARYCIPVPSVRPMSLLIVHSNRLAARKKREPDVPESRRSISPLFGIWTIQPRDRTFPPDDRLRPRKGIRPVVSLWGGAPTLLRSKLRHVATTLLYISEQRAARMTKRKSKGAYMISAVAEMYEIHPQTLRLYEREGLLKPCLLYTSDAADE